MGPSPRRLESCVSTAAEDVQSNREPGPPIIATRQPLALIAAARACAIPRSSSVMSTVPPGNKPLSDPPSGASTASSIRRRTPSLILPFPFPWPLPFRGALPATGSKGEGRGCGKDGFRVVAPLPLPIARSTRSTMTASVLALASRSIASGSARIAKLREGIPQLAEDLDAFDRIDPKLGLKIELEPKDLQRIAGPFAQRCRAACGRSHRDRPAQRPQARFSVPARRSRPLS